MRRPQSLRARQYIEEENERMLRLDKPYWMTSLPERGPVPDDQRSTVVIEAPFYMACTEVSRKQWGTITPLDHSPHTSWLSPAVNVAFEDALEFCKQAGGRLSLPTDAQWEYVARAGMKTPYSRKNIDTSLVNYDGEGDTMQGAVRGERRGGPVDVGTLPGNSWGFREMLGNVAEWVLSSQASPPREGWNQARGGSFAQPAIDVRCASVEWYPPKHRSETIGFRVEKAIPSFARAT
jgi:formylglycine-generating enzyme required for sulfatase activity